MARETITVNGEVPARPGRLFKAWLSAKEHAAFTGQAAEVEPRAGTRHAAWGGYIHGWTLSVDADERRFVQAWRTTDFSAGDPDSVVTVTVTRSKGGARVEIVHTDLPEGSGGRYQKGWEDFYLDPLRKYFAALDGAVEEKPEAKKAAKKKAKKAAKKKAAPEKAAKTRKAAKKKAAPEKADEAAAAPPAAKKKAAKKKAAEA